MFDYDKYKNALPGKYWSLPANKKNELESHLVSENYIPMIKYDGYWARAIVMKDEVLIQSRGISKVTGTYGDYTPLVPHIAAELLATFPEGTVVIGELAFNDLSRKVTEVGSILRCLAPKAIERQKEEVNKIHFFVFDVLAYNGVEVYEKPFEERFAIYSALTNQDNKYIRPATSCYSDEAPEMLEYVWSKGGEGIILVNRHLPYKFGNAQAWHSIKVKKSLKELEGKVIGVLEPTREYSGKDMDNWEFYESGDGVKFTKDKLLKGEYIPNGLTPVTKPYFFNRKSGVIVEYEGRIIQIASGTTDDDGEYLSTPDAAAKIANGELYAVFTGMELTEDSVRHPSLIRLRDDIK